MREQLSIADTGAAALTRSAAEAYDVARGRVLEPHARNTQKAYRNAFRQWCAYCDARGMAWAPIDVDQLIAYLELLSKRLAPNSVRLHLSALCELDCASRVTGADPNPASLSKHWAVKRWLESWSRDNPRAPKKRAPAFEPSELERLLAAAAEPAKGAARAAHLARYVRDRCLILFGVCGAFRVGELAALELGQVHAGERGLRVFVPRSKSDQEGKGDFVGLLPQGKLQLCPIDAFVTWRRLRGEAPGPLFCAITNAAELVPASGLTERQITRLVATYARRAGLPPASSHSLRATFATLAKRKPLDQVMRHGRWKSASVAVGYMRQGALFDDNPSAGLFD